MLDVGGEPWAERPKNPAVIGVDYVEFEPETFKGFVIIGQPDRYQTLALAEKAAWAAGHDAVLFSSACDNYLADLRQAGLGAAEAT